MMWRKSLIGSILHGIAALIVLSVASVATGQTADPKISAAPGGVPVPPVPVAGPPASVAVDVSPLSRVFRVRVVDGRNGNVVERAHLRLWYDETGSAAFTLITNAQGVALLPAPVGTPVRVLIAPDDKVDCRVTQSSVASAPEGINLASLAGSGTVLANHCGRVSEKPRPGELVLFVRPTRWYEGLNRP